MRCQRIVRWTTLFVTLAALFTVVGCGSEPEPSGDTARFPVPTETVPAISTPAPTYTPVPTPTAAAQPSPEPSPASGSKDSDADRLPAPDFTLPSASGGSVTLTGLLEDSKGVVLVFYRGFF